MPAIDHLRRAAARYPDKLAVSDGEHRLTYAELLTAVEALSHDLARSIPPSQAVGLLISNSAWWPVAMLACMASGRPAVPLNPRDPTRRLAEIVAAAHLPGILAVGPLPDSSFERVPGLVWLDVAAPRARDARVLDPVSVDAPALVLYTSGSTGAPKGVVNNQRSILQRVQQYADACHVNEEDVFLPLTGPATIAGCREMLTAIFSGATLHLLDVEAVGLRAVRRQMTEHGVTVSYMVPALIRALITEDEPTFASLRIVRIGGERVLWSDVALIRRATTRSCIVQISYLSTETTGSQWFLPRDRPERGAIVPVGYPLPGFEFAIVDDDAQPVLPGDVGELLIRGPHVLLGLWEEGRVVPQRADPDDPRRRIFATGDLVRLDEEGLLHIVGRKGRQLKINGRRIEPAELELLLRRAPRVSDAVAVATDANELVAFVVASEGSGPDLVGELRKMVRTALPHPLHPTRMHVIPNIPRLPGGKVDAAQLRAFDLARNETSRSADAHARSVERGIVREVQQAWTEVLGPNAPLGRWDEAGGDSLKLLQCVMRLESLLGRELQLAAFTVDMSAGDMSRAVLAGPAANEVACGLTEAAPIVFLFPGSVGYGPSLAAFGASLGKLVQVVPIRYPDLSMMLQGQDGVSDMADAAMEQIMKLQPRSEVRMLGYSLGGAVAFEVAARLLNTGRPVSFLGILDTSITGAQTSLRETLARTLQRIRSHRVTVYRMACRLLVKVAVRAGMEQGLERLIATDRGGRQGATRFTLKLEFEEVLRMRALHRWAAAPKPRLPIVGTLFRCKRKAASPGLGWDRHFAALNVIAIAGGHLDLVVEPHVVRNRPLVEDALAATFA